MNVGIATIAAFLLLLPGVAFIVGVNLADKNVREIVFRNTPAEIGYVIAVSLSVHLFLALLSLIISGTLDFLFRSGFLEPLIWLQNEITQFNAGGIYLDYLGLSDEKSFSHVRIVLIFSLTYFLLAAVVGFIPGFILGNNIKNRRSDRTNFFVKHRWMLDLIQLENNSVSARVVLKDKFPLGSDEPEKSGKEHLLLLEGVLRDAFFGADGKLLYLVFKSFNVLKLDGSPTPYLQALGRLDLMGASEGGLADQLVVEGDKVEVVRYSRRALPAALFETE